MVNATPTQSAMSIFDVLGPVMIGPSSSHTAGAARIGKMGRQILGEEPTAIGLRFYGSLAATYKGHMTDTAVVAGLLGMEVDDPHLPAALAIARQRRVEVSIRTEVHSDRNPNTIEMELRAPSAARHVVGVSVGGGEILMTEIDDHPVRLDGKHEVWVIFAASDAALPEQAAALLGASLRAAETSRRGNETLVTLSLHAPVSGELQSQLLRLTGVRTVREIHPLYDYGSLDTQPLFGRWSRCSCARRPRGAPCRISSRCTNASGAGWTPPPHGGRWLGFGESCRQQWQKG